MMIQVGGVYFEISKRLQARLDAIITLTAKEVIDVWGDLATDETARRSAKNIIRAYLDQKK